MEDRTNITLLLEENQLFKEHIEEQILDHFKSFCEFQVQYATDVMEKRRIEECLNLFKRHKVTQILWQRIFSDIKEDSFNIIYVTTSKHDLETIYDDLRMGDVDIIHMPIDYINDCEGHKQKQIQKKQEFDDLNKKKADNKKYERCLHLLELEKNGEI